MAHCFAIEDLIPVIDPTAYVHPTAVLIGDVQVGPGCYVGPAACLRGDFGRITLKEGSNVQDTCVMHGFPDGETIIDVNGHIGHGAVIHGAHIGIDALVGINSVVMDKVEVGAGSVIGAMAYVSEGMVIPPRSLVVGIPARVVRSLSDKELEWKRGGTREYQQLVRRSQVSQRPVEPLSEPQPDRPRYSGGISKTLKTVRGGP
jgi:phenylacetic acid degradation protein